jgi:Mn-dependent DtxR family transcriptional regulator
MPKTFPIRLEVEEIALGTVLRRLNEMPGIVRLHLDLERGGEGVGRKQLEDAAKSVRNDGNTEERTLKLLMGGPKHVREISRHLGGAKSRAYGAVHQLRKKGLAEAGEGKGMHQLTKEARAQFGLVKALPAPSPSSSEVKHGPAGRASPGSGNIVLRTILAEGPKSPSDVRIQAAERGMSAKSMSGVLERARKNGLVKKNGSQLYELTAKGQKLELTGAAHG